MFKIRGRSLQLYILFDEFLVSLAYINAYRLYVTCVIPYAVDHIA